MTTKRRINWEKMVKEIGCLMMAVLGVVIFICACTKANPLSSVIIAYGYIIGPALTVLSIGGFFEIKNKKSKKTR